MLRMAFVAFIPALSLWHGLRRIRSVGLLVVGIADNSLIPMPGSTDLLTIWLAATGRRYWPFYAAMATVGALLGGYLTYDLARRGGKETLERRKAKKRAEQLYRSFERWGFGAVAVPAMLPPPFPIVPFLLAAGALQYPRKKFLSALALGRGIRFTVIAALGAHYGDAIAGFFAKYYEPALLVLIALAVLGTTVALIEYLRYRSRTARLGLGHSKA
jgi:membrane protein YqaA with SNARE-associated domain